MKRWVWLLWMPTILSMIKMLNIMRNATSRYSGWIRRWFRIPNWKSHGRSYSWCIYLLASISFADQVDHQHRFLWMKPTKLKFFRSWMNTNKMWSFTWHATYIGPEFKYPTANTYQILTLFLSFHQAFLPCMTTTLHFQSWNWTQIRWKYKRSPHGHYPSKATPLSA